MSYEKYKVVVLMLHIKMQKTKAIGYDLTLVITETKVPRREYQRYQYMTDLLATHVTT